VPEVLAAIRPAGQDFPVLLHIVGATIVFGALLASATSLALARGEARMLRLGYFSLLFVALPGMALMWGAGQWIYHKQGWNDLPSNVKDVDWLTIGFVVGDYGGLFFIAALIVGGVGILRIRKGNSDGGLLKLTMVMALVLAVAYVVAVWAMTGKPTGASGAPALGPGANSSTTTAVRVAATEFRFTLSSRASRPARSSSRSRTTARSHTTSRSTARRRRTSHPARPRRSPSGSEPAASSASARSRATRKRA
jgi:hypothetical protein